ncbi:MAG: MEMO1 family protein [Candidatus ainarchaeum sp.]|nr:MEMO1 family protein [Candidatus ainarchaeum sp.]
MRNPAVSGTFYPSRKQELEGLISECFAKEAGKPAPGGGPGLAAVVSPHAGYVYSGWVAAFAFREIARAFKSPPVFVIAGPNHTGIGSPVAMSRQDWQTPLGVAKNDSELGKAIKDNSRLIDFDESAHEFEHSVEVQIPFLQYVYGQAEIVPICMGRQDLAAARDLAEAVAKAKAELKREAVLIASSDFTHFESAESALARDAPAIEMLEKLDAEGFERARERKNASICGHGPITAAIHYARLAGCSKGELLKYANSGDVTGDYGQVVAYCSAAFRTG